MGGAHFAKGTSSVVYCISSGYSFFGGYHVMGTKVVLAICCCILSACAASREGQKYPANEKKYAVAYCLSNSYPNSEFSEDSVYVSGAYLQKGDFGLDMYEEIREFVSSYRKKRYLSKHDRNLNIMQCIDLYESKDLEQLIGEIADNPIESAD